MQKMTALITGASSGIGKELAKLCAQDGINVVLVARTASALAELAATLKSQYNIEATVIVQDLARPAAVSELITALRQQNMTIDILINNAGFGIAGAFTATDIRVELDIIAVNITALTELTKRLMPEMLAQGRGKILNIASTAAFQPGPFMAVYYASKAYVLSFSEALNEELRKTPVSVTALCPGPTKTQFIESSGIKETRLFSSILPKMSAETVAKIGYQAMRRGQRVAIAGWMNAILAFISLITPNAINLKVLRYLNGRR